MKQYVLSYLKRNNITDPFVVDRLLVSIFMRWLNKHHHKNTWLRSYLIDSNDCEYAHIEKLMNKISYLTINLEDLIQLFEYVISPSDRIITGAVYTPKNVRRTILQNILGDKKVEELWNIKIADISCGCGGFLMDAAQWLHFKTGKKYSKIFKENIYGIDIQDYAIERTKVLLTLLALSEEEEEEDEDLEFNLLCRDTLDFTSKDWDVRYTRFDVVVGNPPYVCSRNLLEDTYAKLNAYEVCSSGHPDLYIPFFQIAIEMLNNNGRLGYITMNTFLRSINGRAIRNFFSRNRFSISIVDFRGYQVFDSKNTYTCLFFLDKQHTDDDIHYTVNEQGELLDDIHYIAVPYASLDNEKGWTLNNFNETKAIEEVGIQIKDYCSSRHGIATLSNDTYIHKPAAEDKEYFYIDKDGERYPIERGICRDIVNPNRLNAISNLNLLIEKVIFPYRIENEQAFVYTPDEMRRLFPKTLAYLKTKRNILKSRDKGKTSSYPQWYAFGRTQSLVMPRYKLFFPKFANKPLRCVICDAPDLMLYNGLAFVSSNEKKLRILKAVIESNLFWRYIQANAKPYASGYYSLSGVDIKHFGIPKFTSVEEDELLSLNDRMMIERWLSMRYGLTV